MDAGRESKNSYLRVEIDRDLCIGAGNCCGIAPSLFELDDESKAVYRNPQEWGEDLPETIVTAAWSCPTDAISVFDTDGNRLYPPPDRQSYLGSQPSVQSR
jgi:ferredoxin